MKQPLKLKKTNKKLNNKSVPWWTSECTEAVKTRENMRHRLKDKNNKDNLDKYRQAKNIATSTIRKARRQCWEDFCSNLPPKINSKQLWSFIAKVKGRPTPCNPPFIVNGNIITEAK